MPTQAKKIILCCYSTAGNTWESSALNSSDSQKILLAFSSDLPIRSVCCGTLLLQSELGIQTTGLFTPLTSHSYIHHSYLKKKKKRHLVSLFSRLLWTQRAIKQRDTRNRGAFLQKKKKRTFRESKGRRVGKGEHWVRRESIYVTAIVQRPTTNISKRSHALHCTSLAHSSVDCRVTINVGFHRNNKMVRKQSANTAAIIEMWQIVKFLKIPQRW